jgi:hypothetical protein
MKRCSLFLVICLIIPAFLAAQTTFSEKSDEAEGTKLGNIINTVIGIVLPQVQPIVNMLFPKTAQPNDKTTITKADLETKLKTVKDDMIAKIKTSIDPLAKIVLEVDVTNNVLKIGLVIQDYLEELNFLIANSPITEANWKRVQTIWPFIVQRLNNLSTDKNCDVTQIRNRDVKSDLGKITGLGNTPIIERVNMDFISLPVVEINKGDKATLFRVKMSGLLELFQTIQYILGLSLKELRDDFSGALNELTFTTIVTPLSLGTTKSLEITKNFEITKSSDDYAKSVEKRLDAIINKISNK